MRAREILLCSAAAGCLLLACQLIGGIDERTVAPFEACTPATLPSRPSVADGPNLAPLVLATTLQISADRETDGTIAGFDLDGVCADGGGAGSCVRHPGAAPDLDDPAGRDNGTLALLERNQLGGLFGFSTSGGRFGMLLVLRDWNGGDDPDVSVDFLLSDGVEPATDAGAGKPLAQGNDVWTTRTDSTFDGVTPKYVAQHAYVTRGKVVGQIGELGVSYGLPILGSNHRLMINLSDVVFSLPLARDGNVHRVEGGAIAGRWPTRELLRSLAVLPDLLREGGAPEYICGSNATYQNIRGLVCVGADIAPFRSSDGKQQPCSALSIVLGVSAVQAQMGARFDLELPAAGCDSAPADECPPR